ncbi:MAG: S8 family serine peptidase [Verrucomicrobia bacterium]|nr:S8 family serine peptidase [Verrucomicrobiota bacterium]
MNKLKSAVCGVGLVALAACVGAESVVAGTSVGNPETPAGGGDALAQWAAQPGKPPPAAGGQLQPGTVAAQALAPDLAAEAAPVEILLKLRKGSAAANQWQQADSAAKAAGHGLPAATELSALLTKHAVTSVLPVFGRAKQLPPAEVAAALADPASQTAKREALFRWCRLQLPAGADVAKALADFKANPGVESAEPVYQYRLSDIDPPITGLPDGTTDPMMPQQWHHTAVKSQAAWNYLKVQGTPVGGRRDTLVAVIDTGVDYNHEELVGNIWTNTREIPGNGIDDDANGFIDDIHGCSVTSDSRSHSGDPIDLHGHGTHVAGIIAATAFNLKGGVGLAFNVQIMPIRAAQYSGALTTTDISEAVLYAVDNGAEVINMSFGGYQRSQIVEDTLAMALHQAVLVAAAGNDNLNAGTNPCYPAALPFVHGVMASDPLGKKTWFSNYGYDLAAPGEGILSTLPGNQYAAWSGTSMAAPIVSGLAALMRSYWWQRDIYSSRFLMGGLTNSGSPVVDAYKAVTELPQPGVVLLDTWLFDDKAINSRNDADGRVDSGETIHLAIEAINRSGEAKNVVATLRARAQGAVFDDPYVSYMTDTVNFGNIGPFNTTDNGFIYNASGVITGVERPFVFQVSSDCPNDHVIPFEITFTFLDGWDPGNTTPFTRVNRFNFTVQRGKNLPTVISSDMVLTADEYWIVGGPVLIEPGATLTVMPGTQIQWGAISDDPYNPGPQTGSMIVRGNLCIEGTCEQPVAMFPSYLVGGQGVGIGVQGGTADMSYARVRAAGLDGFRVIDHCYFDADFGGGAAVGAEQIKNSVFHRLRGGGIWASLFECCLFDSLWMNPVGPGGSIPRISNCTFLQDNENNRPMSIISPAGIETAFFGGIPPFCSQYHTDPSGDKVGMGHAVTQNGFTYVTLPAEYSNQMQQAEMIAQYFGGHITSIANQEEQTFLQSYLFESTMPGVQVYCIGLTDEGSPGEFHWLDETPLTYVNWKPGFPVAAALNNISVVTLANQWGLGWPPPESLLGLWQNLTGVVSAYRINAYYSGGPAFILKLPGTWTAAQLNAEVANGNVLNFVRPRMRGDIINNAFLSKYWDPNVNTWMRVRGQSGNYSAMNFNYWGTTSTTLIDHMIVDYYDNFGSPRVDYKPAPAHGYTTTYPFVEQVLINGVPAESVPKLGTERADFTVTFNRDMDVTVEPFVTFGPSSPYTDFQVTARDGDFQPIASGWLNPRTWQGSAWITPMSGDGYHLMRISDAVAADDPWLVSGYDIGRFRFEVRSMEVAAMTLQANGQEGAIHLQWQQDDFDLLAGYNLYRATSATGPWEKLNATVIPPGSENYTDLAVAPAVPMYYKFSVLSTDFQESDFSNVAMAAAIDTIVPTITHVPVTTAAPARGMRVTATATDNLRVTAVTVHYRALGSAGDYTAMAAANLTGNNWSVTIPGSAVVAPGLEYYLVATDGISEAFSGTPVLPHQVTVSNAPTLSSVTPSHGPATGGTAVTLSGMLFEPGISVLFGGVLASDIQLLSAGQLSCVTPAHFPALVDVKVVNPDATESTLLNAFRFEETGVVVSMPNTSGNFGSQVDLAVSASNLVGLRGMDLAITWNPAVLSVVSARVGTVTTGWALASNLGAAGRAVLSLANASAVSGSGSLVVLRFNVIGSPPTSTPLVIESVSLNDGAMTAARSDGLFTVNGFFDLAGNVRYFNGGTAVPGVALSLAGVGTFPATTGSDGAFALTSIPTGSYLLTPAKANEANGITAFDASLVLQKAAGLISLSADETRAADVNRNGTVSAMDASYILEQAVGLIQVPFPGAGRVWDFVPEQRTYSLLNANLTGQDFTAVLLGDVSGNWSPSAAPASPVLQSGAAAYALIHDGINTPNRNTAWLLVKSTQPAIYGLDLSVSYDPALTLTKVRAGALGSNHTVAFHSPVAGSARIAGASALPVSGEGVMLELGFSGPPVGLTVTKVQFDEARVAAVEDAALEVFDQDHDGLINTVETEIHHTNPALADSDGDGQNDGQEVIAGTSPLDTGAVFALKSIENLAGELVRLSWSSVPGRTYRVEVAETLAAGQWVEACPAITAEAGLTFATVAKPPSRPRAFYRIAVAIP